MGCRKEVVWLSLRRDVSRTPRAEVSVNDAFFSSLVDTRTLLRRVRLLGIFYEVTVSGFQVRQRISMPQKSNFFHDKQPSHAHNLPADGIATQKLTC